MLSSTCNHTRSLCCARSLVITFSNLCGLTIDRFILHLLQVTFLKPVIGVSSSEYFYHFIRRRWA